jgi:hypothetical protein
MTKLIFAFRNFANAPQARQGSCAGFFKELLENYDNYDDNNHINQCFPNSFARKPLLASKNNNGSTSVLSVIECPDDAYPKLDSFSELIHKSSIHNNALHDLAFIKMIVARSWVQDLS